MFQKKITTKLRLPIIEKWLLNETSQISMQVLLNLNKILNLPYGNRSWSSTSLYIDDMRQDGPEPWVPCKREGTLERWLRTLGSTGCVQTWRLVRSHVRQLQRLYTQSGCLPTSPSAACVLLSGQHKTMWPPADLFSHPLSPASPQGTLRRSHLGTSEGLIP